MKKRGLSSPDDLDACMLTMTREAASSGAMRLGFSPSGNEFRVEGY